MLKISFHPLNFLIASACAVAATFAVSTWQANGIILLVSLFNLALLAPHIYYRKIAWFALALVPTLIAMGLSSYYFGNESITQLQTIARLENSLNLTARLFNLAMLSFIFMLHLPQERAIRCLMQQHFFSVKIGFSLLAVFNAFDFLAAEFRRIQLAYSMRYGRRFYSPRIILPLLVAASRYAQHLSLSMYTRGLTEKRSYHQPREQFGRQDWLWLVFSSATYLGIVYLSRVYLSPSN